jgi:hypothetical protein
MTAPLPSPSPSPSPSSFERLLGTRRGLVLVYLAFAAAYLGASGGRLRGHSPYNHYVYLAEGWLHGRLALAGPPPNENDWAKVDVLTLRDGRTVKGLYGSRTGGPADRFYPLRGTSETIPESEIATRSSIRYVSFPPLPAVVMLPFVAVAGLRFNDVLFTALWAALNPVLLFLLLRSLSRRGLSRRTPTEDLWLTVMFGVGSVYYYCSVVGEVWFTAHVIAVTVTIVYTWASLDAARPALAGLCVGLGLATRPPGLGFMTVLFLWEAVRITGALAVVDGRRRFRPNRELLIKLLRFAVPLTAVVVVLMAHNWVRFRDPFEFGHRYLNVQWQERIQRFGLINYHFLSRNLAAALVLLPRILAKWPYLKISQHGMSLFVTTPALAYTLARGQPNRLRVALWLTVLATALPSLLYQNSGYIQLGYRFSLDYMVFLMVLLSTSNRPLTRLWKALILVSIPINLFLAVIFGRFMEFSYDDSFFPHGQN